MDPVRSSPPNFPQTPENSPKTLSKQKPTAFEATKEEKQLSQAKNELFSAGVAPGEVLVVESVAQPEILTLEQKITQVTKELLDPVIQAIGNIKGVQLESVSEDRIAAVSAYMTRVPAVEAALYCHFSNIIISQTAAFISALPIEIRPRFIVLVQETIQGAMAESVTKIRSISPEFLINVQLASCKPKLDQLVTELGKVNKDELQKFRDTLETKTVDESLSASQQIEDVVKFIASVSSETKNVIIHCIIKGIDTLLQK